MKAYFFGFSWWKHGYVRPFFPEYSKHDLVFINPFFITHLKKAFRKGLNKHSCIYIWGKKSFPELEQYATDRGIDIFRVEDGFVRSVGLGSDLTQPYSLVVDRSGIYFDPATASDLEKILQTANFDEAILQRAARLRTYLVEKKLSKYNLFENTSLAFPKNKNTIVVPGQVEDDASIRYGANGMTNLTLLQAVRSHNPDAYIVYKPHPDVLVGNRVGHVEANEAMKFANEIVTDVGIDTVLEYANEVHTMTSLVGFEALLRGKKVVTYGLPFYAGWGLTNDMRSIPRRTRKLSLDTLVAATYILYPRYIDPLTNQSTQVETVLAYLEQARSQEKKCYYNYPKKVLNYITRKLQICYRILVK